MKLPLNVLVFPGGSEIGLEIFQSLSSCKEVRLFSAGMDIPSHAPFVFRRHYILPSIHETGWIDALNRLVEDQGIDYIFPAYDDLIVALAQNAHTIHARIISSPLDTCLITRSKARTYRCFESILPLPCIYPSADSVDAFPVFVKPDRGQGAQGACLVQDRLRLDAALANDPSLLILEYLPGEEVTVDCFSDRESGLLFCRGRKRLRTKAGISVASAPVHDPCFKAFGEKISQLLPLHGAWFFQLKRDQNDHFKLLEIAPRIAGTMAMHRVLGINFALLSLYEQERIPISLLLNPDAIQIDRALINRYRYDLKYGTVYVDLDDTLLVQGAISTPIVKFLFQCINKGIPLKLITKHDGDLQATLQKHRLTGLFDEIIHLQPTDKKADHIQETDAILIDDSFSERRAVQEARGIPTFDGSMVEALIDDRS